MAVAEFWHRVVVNLCIGVRAQQQASVVVGVVVVGIGDARGAMGQQWADASRWPRAGQAGGRVWSEQRNGIALCTSHNLRVDCHVVVSL